MWATLPSGHSWGFETIYGTCRDWSAGPRCCPCNLCPPIGARILENKVWLSVAATNICPDDPYFLTWGVCRDASTTFNTSLSIPIPGNLPEAIEEWLQYFGSNVLGEYINCVNVFGIMPGMGNEFRDPITGFHGNVAYFDGCDHCRCSAVRVGYGSTGPDPLSDQWARENLGPFYLFWELDKWLHSIDWNWEAAFGSGIRRR